MHMGSSPFVGTGENMNTLINFIEFTVTVIVTYFALIGVAFIYQGL